MAGRRAAEILSVGATRLEAESHRIHFWEFTA